MALVLSPEPPLGDWLAGLDQQIERSPSFFSGRPVVLELVGLPLQEPGFAELMAELAARGIQPIGIEGGPRPLPGGDEVAWPPVVSGGRSAPPLEVVDSQPPPPAPTSLLLDHSLRSGQSVVFEGGDVTVVGAVASGAEVIAGGSIHVYGALRGRAVAGMAGNAQARIFCRRLEAELLAIDGLYRTADDIEPGLRGRAVQAWLQGQALKIASLD
jgi:septum site-determining protein MinC